MSSPRSFLDTTETVRFRNATYRARALFLLAAGGLVIAAHGVDVVNAGGPNWRALGIRLAWCALLVAQAATLWWCSRRVNRRMSIASALGTAVLYLLLLVVTGRSHSPLFSFAYVLVIVLPMMLVERLVVAMGASALLVAGTWWMVARDASRPDELLGWGHVGVIAFAIAWLLAMSFRRLNRSQAAARRDRLVAMERLHATLAEKQALVGELSEALANVKALSGLLPICSYCKKVRNDEGYWERIEAYISEHSEAQFSHGLCPDCLEKHHGDFSEEAKRRG